MWIVISDPEYRTIGLHSRCFDHGPYQLPSILSMLGRGHAWRTGASPTMADPRRSGSAARCEANLKPEDLPILWSAIPPNVPSVAYTSNIGQNDEDDSSGLKSYYLPTVFGIDAKVPVV